MFTEYDVQAWWLFTPWVLLGVATIAYLVEQNLFKRMQKVCEDAIEGWEKTSARLFESETRNEELEAGMTRANENRFKAEAESRESSAAHREAARKLETAEAELAKYRPNRDKKGHFAPKKKKD